MLKKVLESIIGGAIGLGALYLVAKGAYEAGREVGHEEARVSRLSEKVEDAAEKEVDEPAPKRFHLFGKKASRIMNVVARPDDNRFEAGVEGEDLVIRIKRKENGV